MLTSSLYDLVSGSLCRPGLQWRRQTEADADFVLTLYLSRRWAETALMPGWSDAQRRQFLVDQARLQRLHYEKHYPDSDLLVIEQSGQPVGRLYLHRHATNGWHIVDIALLPAWCGQGIGTAVLRAVLDQADRAGCPCTLYVAEYNPARRLYWRLGFREVVTTGPDIKLLRAASCPGEGSDQ